ncbi:hypothetical protein AHAS_Ahas18G0120700 [Arachis hypogaea]
MRFNPVVQFNYFNNSMDVERCVNGSRKIGVVLKSKVPNDFSIIWHYHGGYVVGRVVDRDLKVISADGRVPYVIGIDVVGMFGW